MQRSDQPGRTPGAASPPGAGVDLLSGLNAVQREAVTQIDGPLLVLAGAGSGKTRVIVHRVAHLLLDRGVHPSRVVAVTFTNKAAAEMRERVEVLLGSRVLGAWIGTFHALCLRILRRNAALAGLAPGFAIYDTDDQLALVKRILRDEAADGGNPPRAFLSRISRAKNAMLAPAELAERAYTPERKFVAHVYARYQDSLRAAGAVDFDDLLLETIKLYRSRPELHAADSARCEHLLVDEYQDTNRPQYLLVRILSSHHGNVCVVGDEDQSIYRFRGAELRNILEFESDHPGARTIRLEQNYRSSGIILDAAGAVVAHNVGRKGKTLWTENPRGEPLELYRAPDDRAEAVWVARRIAELTAGAGFEAVAVLYRTNAQSRQFEEGLRGEGIPYQVVGAVQFYARKEVKDLLAYLRLAVNPADDVAFRRVVNTPARGIGATTLAAIDRVARAGGTPLLEAAARALAERSIPARAAGGLAPFLERIEGLARRAADEHPAVLLEDLVRDLDYETYLEKAYSGLAEERIENVRALVSAAAEYAEESETPTIGGFLDRSALISDADDVGRRPGVTLMTIHCAKGLEFPVVFLVGLEENLFPHAMASGSDDDLEEERRLCYVAMTRARDRLLLTNARLRRLQGTFLPNPPSRFLREVPAALIREVSPPDGGFALGEAGFSAAGSSAADSWARRSARPAPPPPAARPGAERPADGLCVGAWVRHPTFGGGRVVDREGSGRQLKLTIQFARSGRKKILPAYTRLERDQTS